MAIRKQVDIIYYPFDKSFSRAMLKHATMANLAYAKRDILFVTPYEIDDELSSIKSFAKEKFNVTVELVSASNHIENIESTEHFVFELASKYAVINHHYHFGFINLAKEPFEEAIRARLDELYHDKAFKTDDVKKTDAALVLLSEMLTMFDDSDIHQYIIDPIEPGLECIFWHVNESNLTKHFVHAIDVNFDKTIVNPFILYPFTNNKLYQFGQKERSKDFVFGLTAFENEYRQSVIKSMQDQNIDKDYNFYFCYRTKDDELLDTRIKYEDYLAELSEAKTTLTIPAYDPETFSVHRFIEALTYGCISLVDVNAAYHAGFNYTAEMIDFVDEHLVVDLKVPGQLRTKIQYVSDNYEKLLEEIHSINHIKTLYDEETYRKIYQDQIL